MKKLLLILFICSIGYSQDIPAKRLRTDTLKTLSTAYLDSIHIKSRLNVTRPTEFDSLVRFFTNFAVPLGSSYDTLRLAYKADSTIVSAGTFISVSQSNHTATVSVDTTETFNKLADNVITNPNIFTARQTMTSEAVDTIVSSTNKYVNIQDTLIVNNSVRIGFGGVASSGAGNLTVGGG